MNATAPQQMNRLLTRGRPRAWLVGDATHPEFEESRSLLRATADVTAVADVGQVGALLRRAGLGPDVIVLAASRPGMIRPADFEQVCRAAPLAGMVALVGSWCEGELRTGRPWPGANRLYWYEFPHWWRRQLASWEAGGCPSWALPVGGEVREARRELQRREGLIVLNTTCHETADALAGVLRPTGYATAWMKFVDSSPRVRGATAGVWEGRQLDEREANRLGRFCRALARDGAPVVALLDFPRRDRCAVAQQIGAAAVLGKPCPNGDLLAALQQAIDQPSRESSPARLPRAA